MARVLAVSVFLSLLMIALSIAFHFYHDATFLHPESQSFVLNYSDDRSFVEKIFDVKKNDWDQFQARELSYVFDWLDVQWITWSAQQGWLHFFSLTHILSMGFISIFLVYMAIQFYGKMMAAPAIALSLLFLSSPTPFLSLFYFRSSKALVAVSVALIFYLLIRLYRSSPSPRLSSPSLTALALATPLLDKQGLFFILALFVYFLGLAMWKKRPLERLVAIRLGAGVGFGLLYTVLIGPWLIEWIHGYAPSQEFQNLTRPDLHRPALGWAYLTQPFFLIMDQLTFLFGGKRWPQGLIFALLIVAGILLSKKKRTERAVLLAYVYGCLSFMLAVMIYRHSAILWADVRRIYYWTPLLVLVLIGAQLGIAHFLERRKTFRPLFQYGIFAVLLLLVSFNLKNIPKHWDHLKNGHLQETLHSMPELKKCIRQSHPPETYLLSPLLQKNCSLFRQRD